jgi:uncharacterized protein YneF (UPF0154 family)
LDLGLGVTASFEICRKFRKKILTSNPRKLNNQEVQVIQIQRNLEIQRNFGRKF